MLSETVLLKSTYSQAVFLTTSSNKYSGSSSM